MPADECCDLIDTLPDGSRYVAAHDPARSWTEARHLSADLQDVVLALFARRADGDEPPHVVRPADVAERERARERSARVAETLSGTEWERA